MTPTPWFVAIAAERDPIASFSLLLGSEALIVMGITQLLATRARWLETIFGGMDRIYVLHKWLGVAALVLVLAHDTIDAEMTGGGDGLVSEVGETLGEFGLYGLLILGTLTLATFVPYHLWRWTHRFIGAFFACGALHFLMIDRPFSLGDPVGLYISAFCALGLASYAYALFANTRLWGAARYVVDTVDRIDGAVELQLRPEGRPLRASPGQFVFLKFDAPGLGEVHPFTLSRAPDAEGLVRCTIKQLGDYTDRLADAARPGLALAATDGFGRFRRPRRAGREIWIAAGIGVTPFAAWAEALDGAGVCRPVTFYYSVRDAAPHTDLFERIAAADPEFDYRLIRTDQGARLTAAAIAADVGGDLSDTTAFFCGPTTMAEDLSRRLSALGLPRGRFHTEAYELRSGIGLATLARWLLDRALR